MEDDLNKLISLREQANQKKDLPKAKKRRLVATAVLGSLIALDKDTHTRLREYWKTIPEIVPVEFVITCVQALKAIEGGKDATNAYIALMDAAYGKASTDSEMIDTVALADLTKEQMKAYDEELNKEY